MARVPAFQAGYAGSIPVTRSIVLRPVAGVISRPTRERHFSARYRALGAQSPVVAANRR